ncbi:hypothetical protein ACFLQL_00550 [Verrucomicrobiota bacterium]
MKKSKKQSEPKELTDKESKELTRILDRFERQNTPAKADMFNYDDEYIDIEVEWGDGPADLEQMKLERAVLNSKESLKEKVAAME